MDDALTTITNLIKSPPGQVAAGGVLAGIVWKFFERVEAVLTDQTKLEIAVWLLDRKKLSPSFQSWPDTFAKVFDRVFGTKHLSWKCFYRCCLASVFLSAVSWVLFLSELGWVPSNRSRLYATAGRLLFLSVLSNALPDYLSLLESRYALRIMVRWTAPALWTAVILGDLLFTAWLSSIAVGLVYWSKNPMLFFIHWPGFIPVFGADVFEDFGFSWRSFLYVLESVYSTGGYVLLALPAFFTSIWLWLYAGSGFVLKAARRFDLGFDWFNRKFDIEKKPLQSIGLVAGALVALTYWGAVIVKRLL
jgi:hypothetical protein